MESGNLKIICRLCNYSIAKPTRLPQSSGVSRSKRQNQSNIMNRQPSTTMSYPLETALRARKTPITGVRERQFGKTHDVFEGAPCDWSAAQGATHTLYCGEVEGPFRRPGSGTRPAKLAKTVLYVGTDEDDVGNIVWEKWQIATKYVFANAA